MRYNYRWLGLVLCFALFVSQAAWADDFYKGQVVHFVVGTPPGGGYDIYTRLFARSMGKYIPGNPTIVVQNKPGAGMLVAANYIYNRAKPDGRTVGVWNSALILQEALGGRGIQFDGRKYEWIGAPAKGTPTCTIMAFTKLDSMDKILATKREIKMGGIRAGNTPDDMPKVLNKSIGTNFTVVRGFRNPIHILLAMRKGEVDGICSTWESLRTSARAMLDAKGKDRMIPFLTYGNSKDPELAGVPQVTKYLKGKKKLDVFNAWMAPYEFQRPFMLPPGTPGDRVDILRKAFRAAMGDPELQEAAKKSRLPLVYTSGEEVSKLVADILNMTPETKKDLQFLVKSRKP